MKKIFGLALVVGMVVSSYLFADNSVEYGVVLREERPLPDGEWNDSIKVWLGRSCVGEAGFDAIDECVAIAWVYATRYREVGHKGSFEKVIRRYSAAVKTDRRPWLLQLDLEGNRPKAWPSRLSWRAHKERWLLLLEELEEWQMGNRVNPVPTANHFGGDMDTPGGGWVKVSPLGGKRFGNTFYYSRF